jgi:hypothetical protein
MLNYTKHDPRHFDSRLYKGGDGGAGALADQEAARQQKIQAAVDMVNSKFTNNQPIYDDLGNAVTAVANTDLDKQFATANKNNIFGLARSGLLGGSADAEAGGDLAARYAEGKIKAAQAGLGAASDLKSTDEKTRQNLISLSQSGIDTATAATLAAQQSAAAADSARAGASTATAGRLFDDLGQAYLNTTLANTRANTTVPGSGYFGNSSLGNYSGRVTR